MTTLETKNRILNLKIKKGLISVTVLNIQYVAFLNVKCVFY